MKNRESTIKNYTRVIELLYKDLKTWSYIDIKVFCKSQKISVNIFKLLCEEGVLERKKIHKKQSTQYGISHFNNNFNQEWYFIYKVNTFYNILHFSFDKITANILNKISNKKERLYSTNIIIPPKLTSVPVQTKLDFDKDDLDWPIGARPTKPKNTLANLDKKELTWLYRFITDTNNPKVTKGFEQYKQNILTAINNQLL